MKGKLILLPIGDCSVGRDAIYRSKDRNEHRIAKIVHINKNNDEVYLHNSEWIDFVFNKSELFQLGVEYTNVNDELLAYYENGVGGSKKKTLPIPTDEWEKNLDKIGQQVQFSEENQFYSRGKWYDGLAMVNNTRIVAKLVDTPTPILYTEEEVKKLIFGYADYLFKGKAGFDNFWEKNKKK